jgi:hypothetical protein
MNNTLTGKMLKTVFVILALVVISINSYAQKQEIGMLAGVSFYYGDLQDRLPAIQSFRWAGGFFWRQHITKHIAYRANFMYAQVFGADSLFPNTEQFKWDRDRNLAFYADVIEVSAIIEKNLIPDLSKGRRVVNPIIPYVFGGVGVFYFEPKAIHPLRNEPIALRPLQLNGRGYSPIAISFPVGIGIRAYLNRNWQIGFEFGPRFTTTANLDDVGLGSKYPSLESLGSDDARIMVSRNQNSVDPATQIVQNAAGKPRAAQQFITDMYFISGVTVSYRVWPKAVRSYQGKAVRCPRFY